MRDQTAKQTLGWKKLEQKKFNKNLGEESCDGFHQQGRRCGLSGETGRSGPASLIWLEIFPVAEAETAFDHCGVAMSHLPRNFFKIPLLSALRHPRPCESPSSGQTARSRLKLGSARRSDPTIFSIRGHLPSFAGTFSLQRLCASARDPLSPSIPALPGSTRCLNPPAKQDINLLDCTTWSCFLKGT